MLVSILAALALSLPAQDRPIQLLPGAPHYLAFRGKPVVLVGSGEHYGAVLNRDFDYRPYLETVAADGLNLIRVFSGTYREVPGSFQIAKNVLAPLPNRYLAPWVCVRPAQGDRPEAFDLDQFDPAYFERLRDLLRTAGEKGVVVEYVLFCPLYEDNLWSVSPMNHRNNVNQVGDCPREEVFTLKHPKLLEKQLAFLRRAVAELQPFDNVTIEICNEPYFGGVTLDWQKRIAEEIVAVESSLPHRHLIAQNIANKTAKVEAPVHPAVGIVNFHYAEPSASLDNQHLNRALGDDETGFAGTDDATYRREAWLFLLSGGSIFSHLDYSFTAEDPLGKTRVQAPTPGGGSPALRRQLGLLRRFVEELDLNAARPDTSWIHQGVPSGARLAALVVPNRQYAAYLEKGPRAELSVELPEGTYQGMWIDPRTGDRLGSVGFDHAGGDHRLPPVTYAEDAVLRLVRTGDAAR